MPFLDWVNKNQAKGSAREVPYHLLNREATYGDASAAAENLIIQGENLLALKALVPFYAGRVKCIFIDPPYNTQSAFEHYDDRLEHSQWLSMMYPRLALLRDLLAEDGSIWVTIDDSEAHYLKVLMDEVFGRKNFIGFERLAETLLSRKPRSDWRCPRLRHGLCQIARHRDRLVQNMGFERLEMASIIVPQQSLPLTGGSGGTPGSVTAVGTAPDCHIELPTAPDTKNWPEELKAAVQIHPTSQGATLVLKGNIESEILNQAETFVTAPLPPKVKEKVIQQFADHRTMRQAMKAPAQLGLTFVPIPQLCLELDGYLEVVEKDTLAQLGDWSLLDTPIQLDNFAVHEMVNSFEIDVNGSKVSYKHIDSQQLKLNEVASHVSEQDLVRWLDVQVRQPDVSQLDLQAYLVKMMTHLMHTKGFSLTALVRARFQLADAVKSEIERLRRQAVKKGFQGRLFEMTVPAPEDIAQYSFTFDPGKYPARNMYQGSYEFSKHFYPVVHDLREKTGAGQIAEEFRCAQAIDAHPKVKHWVRNIERQPQFSFWLPTATDYFYPDFVAELVDGRVLVVEYKGEPYKTNDDSKEKKQVGHRWEASSNGRCLFLFAEETDDAGRDVFKQLADKLAD